MDPSRINRSELARKTGMTIGGVSRIFSGRRRPSLKSAITLADALGITVDELLRLLPEKVDSEPS